MKKLLVLMMTVGLSLPTFAEQASEASVKKIMEISGAGEMGQMMMNQMMPALKQAMPDASDKFWKDVTAQMNFDELLNSIIPVYQQHLTEEDLQAILAFYNTPAGKNLLKSQPIIMQQSMQIGQQWGQQLFQQVMQKHAMAKAKDK